MIVPTRPRLRKLLADIWLPLLLMFIWDVLVTFVYFAQPAQYTEFQSNGLTRVTLTLLGTVIILLLGFRSNAAYARWWEGRVLWGLMINASRNIARAALSFIGRNQAETRRLTETIIANQVAYVHVLRCQLRGIPIDQSALRLLSSADAEYVQGHSNSANALLNENSRLVAEAYRQGFIDSIQQSRMEAVFVDIANSQGGMERIKKTPLPMQYRLLPQLFVRFFCVLLPVGIAPYLGIWTPVGSTLIGLVFLSALRIGDELVDPFANSQHDLPLTAMCTTIEIDLLEGIDQPAPPPTEVHDGVLW